MLDVLDREGVKRSAVLAFTWRWLSPRYVHEMMVIWHGRGRVFFCPDSPTTLDVHNMQTAFDRVLGGWRWRAPRDGAGLSRQGAQDYLTVFCDDLFFCPHCGRFWLPGSGAPQPLPPETPDSEAVALFQARRDVPEFVARACGGPVCTENAARFDERVAAERTRRERVAQAAKAAQAQAAM